MLRKLLIPSFLRRKNFLLDVSVCVCVWLSKYKGGEKWCFSFIKILFSSLSIFFQIQTRIVKRFIDGNFSNTKVKKISKKVFFSR